MTTTPEHITPAACPSCGCDDITGGAVDIYGPTAVQTVYCNACGVSWCDSYTLTGRTVYGNVPPGNDKKIGGSQ